jgi:Mg2+/Co2+ transporter CorB
LEEVVGKFTTDISELKNKDARPDGNGHYLVDGSANLRDLNRDFNWELPTQEANTLSGAIIQYLETIPVPQTCLRLAGYPMEILQVKDNIVKKVRIMPSLRLVPEEPE